MQDIENEGFKYLLSRLLLRKMDRMRKLGTNPVRRRAQAELLTTVNLFHNLQGGRIQ